MLYNQTPTREQLIARIGELAVQDEWQAQNGTRVEVIRRIHAIRAGAWRDLLAEIADPNTW